MLSHSKHRYLISMIVNVVMQASFPQCISVRAFGKLFLETARSVIKTIIINKYVVGDLASKKEKDKVMLHKQLDETDTDPRK